MKKIIYLRILSLSIFLSTTLFSSTNNIEIKTEKKPKVVDEGHNIKPTKDKTKELTFVDDEVSKETIKLSLEKEGKEIVIKFEKSSKVPLTCKVMRNKTKVLLITKEPKNPKLSTQLIFNIDKSKLKVHDKIIITNRRNMQIRSIELVE